MPNSRPGFICPAKTKGEIRFPGFQNLRKNTLQNSLSISEPIVPITKALEAVTTGQLGLRLSDLWDT